MGNGQNKNDDFSTNPHFNMQQHAQAMAQLQANYTDNNYHMANGIQQHRPPVKDTQFKSVRRTVSLYKPSINIHHLQDTLKIELNYDSDIPSKLEIYIGVTGVEEHPDNKLTQRINSYLYYEEYLQPGKKQSFQKQFPLQGYSELKGSTVIFRAINPQTDQRTQYSLKNIGSDNWKILLQKLEFNGVVTQLHNIYKGGNDTDDCIICFSQKVNTLIQPCNHLCLCYGCCEQVRKSTNTCPICRSNIKAFKRIRGEEKVN